MHKYFRFQVSVAIFLSAMFVTFGYELKDLIDVHSHVKTAIIIFASFIFSTIATTTLSGFLVKRRFFRKYIYSENWVEGYWYNVDLASQGDQTSLNGPAITEISFKDPDLGFETTGYRIKDNSEIYTFSQYVVLVGPHNLYINFATSNALGTFRNIIACGYFYRSPGSKILNTYDGVIMHADGSSSFRQRAKKINENTIKNLKKEYGHEWVDEFLKNYDKHTKSDNKNPNK